MTDYPYLGHDLEQQGYSRNVISASGATFRYEVFRPLGSEKWASDRELINFCADGMNHFGGHVNIIGMYVAHVNVYVD